MVSAGSVVSTPASPSKGGRYRSLDGLRGIAALVVAVCHTFLIQRGLMQAYVDPAGIPKGSAEWWLSFTPVHLAWAGTEMVYIFFVLSGFVLTIPFLGRPSTAKWMVYYPKRLIRLYLPVWGAVALSLALMTAFPRNFSPTDSPALIFQLSSLTAEQIRADMLLWPVPGASNNVLWTLKLEVLFSLLLPAVVLFTMFFRRLNLLKAALLFVPVFVFSTAGPDLRFFLPMFALGSLLAVERDRLRQFGELIRSSGQSGWIWLALSVVCFFLLNTNWNLMALTTAPEQLAPLLPAVRAMILVGACLAMFLAIEGPWRRGLQVPALEWLGSRSFSLYLVHWPVIVTVAVVMGGHPALLPSLAVAVPAFLLVTEGFYRLVERPVRLLCARLDSLATARIPRAEVGRLGVEPVPAVD